MFASLLSYPRGKSLFDRPTRVRLMGIISFHSLTGRHVSILWVLFIWLDLSLTLSLYYEQLTEIFTI